VAGDGKIYFVSEEGKVSVIKAGADWESFPRAEVDGSVVATPAIADSRIYVRTDENLYCFQAPRPPDTAHDVANTPGRFSGATMHRSPGCHPCHPYT
jgi:hypothetical protein